MTTKEKQEAKKEDPFRCPSRGRSRTIGRWRWQGGEGGLRKDAINVLQAGDKRRKEGKIDIDAPDIVNKYDRERKREREEAYLVRGYGAHRSHRN